MQNVSLPRAVPVICALVACTSATFMLIEPLATFNYTWLHHLWLIQYFKFYFGFHRVFPDVINIPGIVGANLPLMYADKLYVIAGLLAQITGTTIAIRIIAFLALLLQFGVIYRAIRITSDDGILALTCAALVTWAIYPLTNLYNRGDLTEFIAVAFLTSAVASLIAIIVRRQGRSRAYELLAPGLFYAVAAVIHPITAAFGALTLGAIGTFGLLLPGRRKEVFRVGLSVIGIAAILAPWLYVVIKYRDQFAVTGNISESFRNLGFFPRSLDNIWSRLSPLPLDLRSLTGGVRDIDTPYLDAQISVPLLAVLGYVIASRFGSWRKRQWQTADALGWFAAAIAVLAFAISVHPSLSDRFGGIFDYFQIPYRLVNYVNIGLLASIIAFAACRGETLQSNRPAGRTVLTAAVAVAAVALVGKLLHAAAVMEFIGPAGLPPIPNWVWVQFNTYRAYQPAGDTEHSKNTVNASLPVGTRADFGIPGKLIVQLEHPSLVVTDVQQFLWNRLVVDGALIPPERIFVVQKSSDEVVQGLAVELSPGRHEIEYVFQPPTVWRVLMLLSWIVLTAWTAAYFVLGTVAAARPVTPAKGSHLRSGNNGNGG